MQAGEKKSAGKNTKFQYAIQTLLALGAYSCERTHISFTVLDTPPNKNYCFVSHYSLLVGTNVIHVCFTVSLPSLCFESTIMLSSPSSRRWSSPRVPCPTRTADRMHSLVSLQHGSRYCQRTLVATYIANFLVFAPRRVVRCLDNNGHSASSHTTTLLVHLMLGREERGSTYIHVVIEYLLQSTYSALASQLSAPAFPESQLLLPSAHHTSRCAGAN